MPNPPVSAPRFVFACHEDLDGMPQTARGSLCDKCQHDVVDLRRTPRKKALAVLRTLKAEAEAKGGRVCARANARPDGTAVFLPDPPSLLTRIAGPIALASSLAACSPSATEGALGAPIAVVPTGGGEGQALPRPINTNGTPTQPGVVIATTLPPTVTPQPATLIVEPPIEMAGEMVWDPSMP